MSDLTPERLNQIEKAATRRQVMHTYVNGEPDGMTNATLALTQRVRELEDAVLARDMFIDRVWARVADEARHHKRENCGEDDCEAHDNCTTCWQRWPCPIVEAAALDRPAELGETP